MTPSSDPATRWPRPWLVADVGGTHARFGWIGPESNAIEHVLTLPVADHAGLVAAARSYLERVAPRVGSAYTPPRAAAIAVATAVGGDQVVLTNSRWQFSRRAAARELGLATLRVLNDFEALALALPRLGAGQVRPIGPLPAPAAGDLARAVIGPGTGLGVAGLVPCGGGHWAALPGEGGHATLAPADDFESALLAAVRREFPHVSAERLLSGIGLPVLYRALAAIEGHAAASAAAPGARDIVARGLTGEDALASRTIDQFCALLGGFAGNVALTLGARGGVYLGGGIVPRLGDRFFASSFRQRFEAKGRFAAYLQAIPTLLITDTLAALAGAASTLEHGPD